MTKIETAVARFEEGCPCAQAIFSAYAKDFGTHRAGAGGGI